MSGMTSSFIGTAFRGVARSIAGRFSRTSTSSGNTRTANATSLIRFNSDGTTFFSVAGFSATSPSFGAEHWYLPAPFTGVGSSYWIRATQTNSGQSGVANANSFSGTLNTWLALSTNREWSTTISTLSAQGTATVFRTLTFEFATDSGGANIVASHTLTDVRVVYESTV